MNKSGNIPEVQPPTITSNMVKGVSQYRRAQLEEETNAGLWREAGSSGIREKMGKTGKTEAGNVVISKKASSSGAAGWRGSGGTVNQASSVYSPLWLNSNLNLPRDRATINAWTRSFYALNPIVQNAINLHSTYPISKMNIKCKDKSHQRFFEQMCEEIDLENVCVQLAQEFWTLGEAFPYAELDNNEGKWARILLQNPDYITIKRSVIASEPIISLRPDENLRKICMSNKPGDLSQRDQLHPSIVEHVRRGENIPFSNFYISHIARKIAPYETRGTSIIVSCFRSLMLWDKIKEAKFYQADTMINPTTLVKIGGGTDGFKPTPEDLEMWRQVFEEAESNPNFKIFTHDAVAVERVGFNNGIMDTTGDLAQLMKEIYIGLMVPQVIMDTGDITYANGGVSLDVLRSRYMQFRRMLASWLRRKIFAPISKIQEFYEYVDGEKHLVVPEIDWNHMSLFDTDNVINQLTTLLGAQPRNVSIQSVYRSMGLDYEEEKRKIRQETIDQVILAKEMESAQRMHLNELRSIQEGSEIQESEEKSLPGESEDSAPEGGLPGMSGGEGGGMPPPPPMPGEAK